MTQCILIDLKNQSHSTHGHTQLKIQSYAADKLCSKIVWFNENESGIYSH